MKGKNRQDEKGQFHVESTRCPVVIHKDMRFSWLMQNFEDAGVLNDWSLGFPSVPLTLYADLDGDGFGDPSSSIQACDTPIGYVANSGDCDDQNPSIHPGALELCNNLDDDCDGFIDDGIGPIWYVDADGDGYGNALVAIQACLQPSGYVTNAEDCDDQNPSIHPGATEVCNNLDDDCNSLVDENAGPI